MAEGTSPEPLRMRERQKSDLTEKIELSEHRMKLRAANEDGMEGTFRGGQHEGMLVAVASTQANQPQHRPQPTHHYV